MKKNLFCLLVFLALAAPARATITVLHYWRLGENDANAADGAVVTNTTDLAGTNNLPAYGSPLYSALVSSTGYGDTGSSLCLLNPGPTNYLHGALLEPLTNNFGVECWVNPGSAPTYNQCLVYNGDTGLNGWGLYQFGTGFSRGAGFGVLMGDALEVVCAPATPGQWVHLALVESAGTNYFYVNGSLYSSNIFATMPYVPAGAFGIGAPPPNFGSEFFSGWMDEVRVFTFDAGLFSTNDLLINQADANRQVTTLADAGVGSLRETLAEVQPGGSVSFATNLSGQTIRLTSGALNLVQDVTVDASALPGGMVIDGNSNSPIFAVAGTVTLNALTLSNGYGTGVGGAIASYGNLTLENCQVLNSHCDGTAGAIGSIFGLLTMSNTTVSGNVCDNCSAIYIQDQPATLVACTLSGNTGAYGDALRFNAANVDSPLSAVNCTFSGNTVNNGVAAISLYASPGRTAAAMLTNCTIASNVVLNTGQDGAILLVPSGGTNSLTFYNTIVCGNTSAGAPLDITGAVNPASAFNLIGVGGGLVNGVNGNLVGMTNPQLAPLGHFGGPTQTMPPLPGSPAVDAGSDVVTNFLSTDQRGLPRLSGQRVDIGAVELQLIASPTPCHLIAPTRLAGGAFQFTFTNMTGASFRVLAATNLAIPLTKWTVIGFAAESPPGSGNFQFADLQAATNRQRFYGVSSP